MKKQEFLKIIETHKEFIYKTCLIYCLGLEQRKLLELNIFKQIWLSLNKAEQIKTVENGIHNVILNTAISFYSGNTKKNKTKRSTDFIVKHTGKFEIESDYYNDFREHLNKFEKALILLYFENFNETEIANILNIRVSNIPLKLSSLEKKFRKKDETKKNKGFELNSLKDIWVSETNNLKQHLQIDSKELDKKRIFKTKKIFNGLFSLRLIVLILSLVFIVGCVFVYANPETKNTYFLLSLYFNVIIIYLFSSFFKFKKGKKIKENTLSVLPYQKEFNLFDKSYLLFKKIDFLIAPITLLVALFSASLIFEKYNPILAYKNHEKLPLLLIILSISILVLEFLAHTYYKYLFEKKTKNVHRILKEVRDFELDS